MRYRLVEVRKATADTGEKYSFTGILGSVEAGSVIEAAEQVWEKRVLTGVTLQRWLEGGAMITEGVDGLLDHWYAVIPLAKCSNARQLVICYTPMRIGTCTANNHHAAARHFHNALPDNLKSVWISNGAIIVNESQL